jgi:hypothetical protein
MGLLRNPCGLKIVGLWFLFKINTYITVRIPDGTCEIYAFYGCLVVYI